MRPCVCSGVRLPSCPIDAPAWDLSPGLFSESAIGFAQAVGAHRADLAPAPDLLLCLLTGSLYPYVYPKVSVCGPYVCLGPLLTRAPWNRVLTLWSNFAH